jgi:hypothetical protein
MKRARDNDAEAPPPPPSLADRLRSLETSHMRLGMREGQTTIEVADIIRKNESNIYPSLGDGHLRRFDTGELKDDAEGHKMPGHAEMIRDLVERIDMEYRSPDIQFARFVEGFAHNRRSTAYVDDTSRRAELTSLATRAVTRGMDQWQKAATAGPGKKTEVLQTANALLAAATVERQQAFDLVATPLDDLFKTLHLERFAAVAPLDIYKPALKAGGGYLMPYYWRWQYATVLRLINYDHGDELAWQENVRRIERLIDYDRRVLFRNGWEKTLAGNVNRDGLVDLLKRLINNVRLGVTQTNVERDQHILDVVAYVMERDCWLRPYRDWIPQNANGAPIFETPRPLSSWLGETLLSVIQHSVDTIPASSDSKPIHLDNALQPPREPNADISIVTYGERRAHRGIDKGLTLLMTSAPTAEMRTRYNIVTWGEIVNYTQRYTTLGVATFPVNPTHLHMGVLGLRDMAPPPPIVNTVDLFRQDLDSLGPFKIGAAAYLDAIYAQPGGDVNNTASNKRLALRARAELPDFVFAQKPLANGAFAATWSFMPSMVHYTWACDAIDRLVSPIMVALMQRLTYPLLLTNNDGAAAANLSFRFALPAVMPKSDSEEVEKFTYLGQTVNTGLVTIDNPISANFAPEQLKTGDLLKIIRYSAPPLFQRATDSTQIKISNLIPPPNGRREDADSRVFQDFIAATRTADGDVQLDRFQVIKWHPQFVALKQINEHGNGFEYRDRAIAAFLALYTVPAMMSQFSLELSKELLVRQFRLGSDVVGRRTVQTPLDIDTRPAALAAERTVALRDELENVLEQLKGEMAVPPSDADKATNTRAFLGRLRRLLEKAFEGQDKAAAAIVAAGTAAPVPLGQEKDGLYRMFLLSGTRSGRYLADLSGGTLLARVENLAATRQDVATDTSEAAAVRAREERFNFWTDELADVAWPRLVYFLDYVRWCFGDHEYWDARLKGLEDLHLHLEQQWRDLATAELQGKTAAELAAQFFVPTVADQLDPIVTGRRYLTPKFQAMLHDAYNYVTRHIDPSVALEDLTGEHTAMNLKTAFAKFVAALDLYYDTSAPSTYLREKAFTQLPNHLQTCWAELRYAYANRRNHGPRGAGGASGRSGVLLHFF